MIEKYRGDERRDLATDKGPVVIPVAAVKDPGPWRPGAWGEQGTGGDESAPGRDFLVGQATELVPADGVPRELYSAVAAVLEFFKEAESVGDFEQA